MAAGKAIIASDIGQVSEVLIDNENGMLFEPDRVDELQRKTIWLLENVELRRRLGEQARRAVLANYTWEHHAKKIIAIFEEILTRRNKNYCAQIKEANWASRKEAEILSE